MSSGMSTPQPRKSRWWQHPLTWWWRSLPLRVVASVLVASLLVLLLGGFVLMKQATNGVLEGKKRSVTSEARAVVDNAQQRLNATDQSVSVNSDELLTDLAMNVVNRPGGSDQYEVVLITRGQTIRVGRVSASSIPQDLRRQVAANNDMYLTPTLIRYDDGRPSVPGFAVGSSLSLAGAGRYEIYFVFPLQQEMEILTVLRNSVVSTGALLVVLLTLIAALVSRQVVTPVRAARRAAESLASGNLDDRMKVRGQDDLARLATSMNFMASELQKQINQLEELSRVQQRFVSDVSHELRTPLTTVRMAAEVLHEARDRFDPIAARSAELLQTELDRFEALLTDLLEISRFDAGAAVLAVDEVDLCDIVHRVVSGHQRFADAAGSVVTVHSSGPMKAEVDARRIERIIRNLLVNAIEHSEGRPIDIFLAGDERAVAVAVRDHGVGFEAGQAKQVFHRFWRADPARARTMGGTGLGLSIAMEDARLHGGWLTAWGRPGLGAQFRLTLPRHAGDIVQQSPLPLVPRDVSQPARRTDDTEPARASVAAEGPPPSVQQPETPGGADSKQPIARSGR
jgi:two-component system sensor histidine kinase MtrB